MPVWDPADALSRLRSALADGSSDKFVFKTDVHPAPDGTTKTFSVEDYILVTSSLQAYVNGSLATVDSVDVDKGQFTLNAAPAVGAVVQASYQWQWFTDTQLQSFLMDASNNLGLTDVNDENLPIAARPVVLAFAKYHAYMFKAAEAADVVVSSEEGFTVDKSKSHPNWKSMADRAFDTAMKMLDVLKSDPLGLGTNPVSLKIVTWGLGNYVPKS